MNMLIRHFYHHAYFSHPDLEEVWHPATDIYQAGNKLAVKMELPGCSAGDIHAAVYGDRLVVKGIKKNLCSPRPEMYHQMEIHYGRFQRTIQLPAPVDTGNIKVGFDNGVLLLEFSLSGEQPGQTIILDIE